MRKILSIALIAILVLNLIFFGLGKSTVLQFWVIIGLVALAAKFLKN